MLAIEGLTVRYGDSADPALRDVSLSLALGERVALVGPSGAGKTTLLRAIGGSVPLAAGRILLAGIDINKVRGPQLRVLRRGIATIAQPHELADRRRVYRNVMEGARGRWSRWHALRFLLRPRPAEIEEARVALERVGVAEKLVAPTGELSGDQQQCVAIARALVQQPVLMLADEPIASLDPDLAEHVLSLLCRLAGEERIGLLCVLQQHGHAERLFDRVVRLHDGALGESGPPDRQLAQASPAAPGRSGPV